MCRSSKQIITPCLLSALVAVLNSTLVGLFKTFYGRFAGTAGNLKTEVVDVRMLEVPNPQGVTKEVSDRLAVALKSMMKRDVGRLVEEQLMDCHSPERARAIGEGPLVLSEELQRDDRRQLDDAVFELLGVTSAKKRRVFVDRLHEETARHFRQIRVVEIQKMEQRTAAATKKFRPDALAADAWDAFQGDKDVPIPQWLDQQPGAKHQVTIPFDSPVQLAEASHMYDSQTVYFGKDKQVSLDLNSRDEAELVYVLAKAGVHGVVSLPKVRANAQTVCTSIEARLNDATASFRPLAASRTNNEKVQEQVVDETIIRRLGKKRPMATWIDEYIAWQGGRHRCLASNVDGQ